MNAGGVSMSAPGPIQGMTVGNMSVENALLKMAETGGNATNIVTGGNASSVANTSVIVQNNQKSDIGSSLQDDR
jgi:hypothetical protein